MTIICTHSIYKMQNINILYVYSFIQNKIKYGVPIRIFKTKVPNNIPKQCTRAYILQLLQVVPFWSFNVPCSELNAVWSDYYKIKPFPSLTVPIAILYVLTSLTANTSTYFSKLASLFRHAELRTRHTNDLIKKPNRTNHLRFSQYLRISQVIEAQQNYLISCIKMVFIFLLSRA